MSYNVALVCFALLFAGAYGATCTGSARYRVSNSCNWNSMTHPTDYPSDAHWSPLCGTVHNSQYRLFYEDGTSTDGVREVAETGNCDTLLGEITECEMAGYCAEGGYVRWMCDTSQNPEGVGDGVCTHSGSITVTADYPYVSMISMVAPSPDWFVGVADVNLCRTDEESGESYWVDRYPDMPARLYAYDAGTDSGESFASENSATTPFEPITQFLARDASNIFYNQAENVLNPLCMIMLEKE